jgi:hypothetical protein
MPKQVDKTRSAPPPDPDKLPPSVVAEQQERGAKDTQATGSSAAICTTPAQVVPPTPAASTPSTSPWTASPTYAKLHKIHCVKIRSLSKPLDRTPRDQSRAVEWTVDLGGERVRAWAAQTDSFKPDKAAVALGERKPERIWVPDVGYFADQIIPNPQVMPGGKLFDSLSTAAKLPSSGEVCISASFFPYAQPLSLIRISLQPGAQSAPTPIDLSRPAGQQLDHGDVLVLVRGWNC